MDCETLRHWLSRFVQEEGWMVCPGQQQHTYLLSLGFQGLQVVGHSFQLFLKLRAFAGVLHTERRGEEEGEDEK